MGGIAGMVHFKKNFLPYKSYNALLVRDMADSLKARGPDGGEWVGEHTALACRYNRAGQQLPLSRIVGGYEFVLVFDGVLTGSEALYQELRRFGYRFETGNDAELLLYAYIHYGTDCARMLDGMYAFCVWDSMRQQIFACRDRAGARPFYYLYQEESFLFGSAVRALFRHPAVRPEINRDSLRTVLSAGPWSQGGVFAGIEELLPGHSLIVNRGGLRIRPYWELPGQACSEDAAEAARRLEEMLRESLQDEIRGRTPAVILTGRPGSNLLAAMAASVSRDPIFTCSFSLKTAGRYYKPQLPQNGSDALYRERMIEELDSHHTYCAASVQQLADLLPAVTENLDLPGAGLDAGALLYFCREMAREHEKLICAAGFDLLWTPAQCCTWAAAGLSELLLPAVEETLDLAGFQPVQQYPVPALTAALSWIDRLGAGLQIWTPFIRRELLEYVQGIPIDMRKTVFQRIAGDYLPADVLDRENFGWPGLYPGYYAETLKNSVLAVLEDSRAPALAFFDRDAVRNRTEQISGRVQSGEEIDWIKVLAYFLEINRWLAIYQPRLI